VLVQALGLWDLLCSFRVPFFGLSFVLVYIGCMLVVFLYEML
jgi:hypothetical protein